MINVIIHQPGREWQTHAMLPALPREGDTVTLSEPFGETQTTHLVDHVHFKPVGGCAFFEVHVLLKPADDGRDRAIRTAACARLRAIIDNPATLPAVGDDLRVALALIDPEA